MTKTDKQILILETLREIIDNMSYYPEEGDIWSNEFERELLKMLAKLKTEQGEDK